MAITRRERHYHCWNDCQQSGCPGHTATLEYQSVGDSLHFQDGKGQEMYMQPPELKAFLAMIQEFEGSLIHRRGKSMTTLSDLTPLLQRLHAARGEQHEAFTTVNKALRPEGYSLYWDDSEERYCIYALPQLLGETYQKGQDSEGT